MLLHIQYTDKFDSSFTDEQLVQLASSATQDKTTTGDNRRSRASPPCLGLVPPHCDADGDNRQLVTPAER